MEPQSGEIRWCHKRLVAVYGTPSIRSTRDPLDSLMRTVLSQNTSDTNRDKAYRSLKEKFPTWNQVKNAAPDVIEDAIRSGGLANQKTATMQRVLQWLTSEFGSLDISWICTEDPDTIMDMFTRIKGIGIKTMAVVLCFACQKDIFPVDTHVNRICIRLGLVSSKSTPDKTFRFMNALVPAGLSQTLHLNMIRHGRETCKARKPNCTECVLLDKCDYGQCN